MCDNDDDDDDDDNHLHQGLLCVEWGDSGRDNHWVPVGSQTQTDSQSLSFSFVLSLWLCFRRKYIWTNNMRPDCWKLNPHYSPFFGCSHLKYVLVRHCLSYFLEICLSKTLLILFSCIVSLLIHRKMSYVVQLNKWQSCRLTNSFHHDF